MATLPDAVQKKLLEMKALFGDETSKHILETAEQREKAAVDAGLEFKTVKVDSKTPASLASLLETIETGLAAGTIVDDVVVTETEPAKVVEAPKAPEAPKTDLVALKAMIAATVDERLQAFVEKAVKPDPKAEEIQTKLKAAEDNVAALKAQMDELNGVQPKNAGHRASQSDTTVVKEGQKFIQPGPDPVASFVSEFVLGGNGAKAP